MNTIQSMLFSEKNIKILKTIGANSGLNIRDLAKASNCSPAQVHNAVKLFDSMDLVFVKRHKNMLLVHLNKKSRLLKKMDSLLKEFGGK